MVTSLIQRFNVLKLFRILLNISILTLMSGCQDKEMPNTTENVSFLKSAQDVEWQKLSEIVIFFGHQSVGNNILDGIRDIARENPKVNLLITDHDEGNKNSGPLFIHSRVGKNGEPITKVDDFKEIMNRGMGTRAHIAFMKFCYVDLNKATDVEKVFDYYKNTVNYLREKYPKTTFVHVTVPVEANKSTWKTWIKKIIGEEGIWEYENDISRWRYNTLLRKEYEGKEPIFDLAMIESTYTDGKQEFFEYQGIRYPAMVPEYTTDGGHLNEKGRKIVAEKLLIFLSNTSNWRQTHPLTKGL